MGNLDTAFADTLIPSAVASGDLLRLLDEAGTVISGGSYADQPITWISGSDGMGNTADVVFADMPAANIVSYEIWDSTGTTRKWVGLISETTGQVAVTADDTITTPWGGVADGDPVFFSMASGVSTTTLYYVVSSTGTGTFQIATSVGGSPVSVGGNYAVSYGFPVAVGAGDTFTIAAGDIYVSLV